ncbi:uncharacterized protein LOC123307506 [Coccinella septempunctata]|uniref:uncharacterized protein LOC123307506 n=1 Tax=Coccinella septempunctata TaxID=41139 RepID=UPI001D0791FC|nr:uncharacterized protein LOC123307506 [Coccinella septempunctata]
MTLSAEQKSFLEECEIKFSERYTNCEPDFAQIHGSSIPPPPIVFPWYGKSRYNRGDNRGQPNRSYNERRDDRGSYTPNSSNDSGRFGRSKNY